MTLDVTRPSSTQIGAIAECLVASVLMLRSGGRLSPFRPFADDDGIDLLIYDKLTGRALPAQIKSRTVTLKRHASGTRGNTVHFEVRKATFRGDRHACCLFVLLTEDATRIERSWVIPMRELITCATERSSKYVVRASKLVGTGDRFGGFQCENDSGLVERVFDLLAQSPGSPAILVGD